MSDTKYVKFEDVPQSIINHEKEVEMGKEDILQKPEKFRCCFTWPAHTWGLGFALCFAAGLSHVLRMSDVPA